MQETSVTMTWTCDVCGGTATTPRGLPDGWREVRIAQWNNAGHEGDKHHVCGSDEPSCFRRLLIKLANEDKRK